MLRGRQPAESRHVSDPPAAEAMLWRAAGIWQRVSARRALRSEPRDAADHDSAHHGGGDEACGDERRHDDGKQRFPTINSGDGLKHTDAPPSAIGQSTRTLR